MKHTPEQIIEKLRDTEPEQAKGQTTAYADGSFMISPPNDRRLQVTHAIRLIALACLGAALLAGWAALELRTRRGFDHVVDWNVVNGAARPELANRSTGIALIGDSWVAGRQLDAPLETELARLGLRERAVLGIGESGAKSRRILRNLLDSSRPPAALERPATHEPSNPVASGALLESGWYRYCVVIAGVNDVLDHFGADFYAHHLTEIAGKLLERGITPVLVELPEFGVEEAASRRRGLRGLAVKLMRVLFDSGRIDVIEGYRLALEQSLADRGIADRVIVVDFDAIVPDYHAPGVASSLFADPVHLNENGRRRLARAIAIAITNSPETGA